MSENINELYKKIDFLVSGGALESLTDFLTEKGLKALVVEKGIEKELNVIGAAGIIPESLTLSDEISQEFCSNPVKEVFEIDFTESSKTWPEIFRIRGEHWEIFLLLKEKVENREKFIEELRPYGGLIRLWRAFKNISETEKKLSSLSYMILATKNTLASIFEPMPLEYFASFLSDVLQESLFPKSILILKDSGNSLEILKGKAEKVPERKGIFEAQILPPAPVITAPCEIVLPIAGSDTRLFCVMTWEKLPDEQTMNFLELLGNLATRAIAINNLRIQAQKIAENVSAGIIELEKRLIGAKFE